MAIYDSLPVTSFKMVIVGLDGQALLPSVGASTPLPVAIYSGGVETPLSPASDKVDNSSFTAGTSKALPLAALVDETAPSTITEDFVGALAMTPSRSLYTTLKPFTKGGQSVFHLVSAATTNATVVKASTGQLYGWYLYNSNAAARKVAFHNTASAPTAGASIFFTVVLPPGGAANVAFPHGIAFSTGIAITTVTGLTDADATAVAANDLIINLFYT